MSAIHFIGGEKGGVGKSVVARLVAQYLIDHGQSFITLDTDLSHGAMQRFYKDYSQPVNLSDYESADQIMEAALNYQTVIVDLAAQSHRPLERWINDNEFFALAEECGVQCYFWHVMEDSRDSLMLLGKLLDCYSDACRYVVVKNAVRGGQFDRFENSQEKQRAEALGADIIAIRELHDQTMRKIDQADASFWAAQNRNDDDSPLGMMERQRARVWLRAAYQELEGVGLQVEAEAVSS